MGNIEEIKIEATMNCIKNSETILNGEYYVVHSDFIIALEEEIKKLTHPNIIIKVDDVEEVREKINDLSIENKRLNNIINELEIYIKGSDECWDLQAVLDKLNELKENNNESN